MTPQIPTISPHSLFASQRSAPIPGGLPAEQPSGLRTTRAFTLVEVLFSILILGILISLLFVAFRSTRAFAVGVSQKDAIVTLRMAVSKFQSDYNFLPPLVREQAISAAIRRSVEVGSTAGTNRFAVYNFSTDTVANATDLNILRPATLTLATADNPFEDQRYSERTVPYYLAGVCEVPFSPGAADASVRSIPVDGVVGPGMFRPRPDGSFELPRELLRGNAAVSRRGAGDKVESLVDLNKRAFTVFNYKPDSPGQVLPTDAPGTGNDPQNDRFVELRDSKGIPVRYYRWLNGAPYVVNGQNVYEVRSLADYRVPPLVGRLGEAAGGSTNVYNATPADRDITQNPSLRTAKFAIVGAGADGAFGDEPLPLLLSRLSLGAVPAEGERALRVRVELDNIIEVGD